MSNVGYEILVTSDATIATESAASLTVNGLEVASNVTATIAAGSKVYLPNTSLDNAVDINENGTLVNNGTLAIEKDASAIVDVAGIKGTGTNQIRVKTDSSLVNKGKIGGEQNTQMGVLVLGSMDNSEGELYGTVNVAGSQYWKKGTEITYADLYVNKADLTEFAGAKSVTAVTTPVTTLPEGTNVIINVASPNLALAAAKVYGVLTIKAETSMTTAGASSPSSITQNRLLHVD